MGSWQSQGATLRAGVFAADRAAVLASPARDSAATVHRLFLLGVAVVVLAKGVEFAIFGNIDLSYDPWSLLGLVVAQGFYDSSVAAIRAALILGLAITVALLHAFPLLSVNASALGLAAGSLISLVPRLGAAGEQRRKIAFILALGLLMPLAHQVCLFSQRLTTVHADTYDHRAFLVDASLGLNPAGAFANAHLLDFVSSGLMIGTIYTSLTFMMTLVVLWKVRLADRSWTQALAAFVLAGVLGTALYHFFPVAGPRFAFPDGIPDPHSVSSAAAFLDQNVVRNGMPSLHTGWAFLIMINAGGLPKWFRIATVAYLAAMLLATLATGQHYLVDLIVALPFAVAVQAITVEFWRGRNAYGPFWFGALATGVWIFLLKEHVGLFLSIPGFTLISMTMTVAASAAAVRRLAAAG